MSHLMSQRSWLFPALVILLPLAAWSAARISRRMARRGRLVRMGLTGAIAGPPWWVRRPRMAASVGGVLAGAAGWKAGGPVAAILACAYGALGVLAWLSRRRRQADADSASRALDAIVGLAGDLRAGLAPGVALAAALPALTPAGSGARTSSSITGTGSAGTGTVRRPAGGMVHPGSHGPASPVTARRPLGAAGPSAGGADADLAASRVAAAWEVAEVSGAPLAELLDRLDADLRSVARVRTAAHAHGAGVRTTAILLAALPIAGLALGFAIGADPLDVMLHTRPGAACAVSALVLQLTGLAWSNRLVRTIEESG